jgi:uncharacterized Zn-binding protein involved in type VI secretion
MRVARVNQETNNHGYKIIEGADTVFVNDLPLALQGSAHARGATVVAGSLTVFAEGRQVAREADSFSDGTNIGPGSSDVFVNDPN